MANLTRFTRDRVASARLSPGKLAGIGAVTGRPTDRSRRQYSVGRSRQTGVPNGATANVPTNMSISPFRSKSSKVGRRGKMAALHKLDPIGFHPAIADLPSLSIAELTERMALFEAQC